MLNLTEIRHKLHSMAEVSGKEKETSLFIVRTLEKLKPDSIMELSGSVIAVFNGKVKGKNIALRADIDALPISEKNGLKYASKNRKVSHLCGHDGHSAILLGLAEKISIQKPKKGNIILIFQSAEETGQGAKKLISNKKFKDLKINEIYGFHNIPGFKAGEIIIKDGVFASASTGMIIEFRGKTSHASEPEKGISPVPAISWLIRYLDKIMANSKKYFKTKALVTIVGIKAGKKDFGVSPDRGEIYLTLRAQSDDDIEEITDMIRAETSKLSDMSGLNYNISFTEEFPSVVNDAGLMKKIKGINEKKRVLTEPFQWSEDFGWYSKLAKSCFIGIGVGNKHPPLHAPEYDFCDEIIEPAVSFLYEMIKSASD